MIDGARRVGKSTIAEAFGKNEYERHVVVDFAHPKASVVDAIRNDPGNLDAFFKTLEYEYRVKLVSRNSLIVFDEVQLCPEARQMIKYLVADQRYDLQKKENRMEIDFLIRRGGKISPVEVKSSRYAAHSSLDKFRVKFGNRIGEAFILYTKDVQIKDGITHLPIYMAGFL